MPTRNEVLMRSANLLNDFAFKYVFGEDCKEANDALKSLLTVFLEKKVNKVVVKNSEIVKDYSKMKSPRLDLLVEFDDRTTVDLEMQLRQTKDNLLNRFNYYLARLHGSQDMEGKSYSQLKETIVMVFFNLIIADDDDICSLYTMRKHCGIPLVKEEKEDRMKLMTIEMPKVDLHKPLEDMNEQEKMIYYFLNCHKGMDDSKIKVMIEKDGVIQMLEKRVETISDDGWKKIIEDFRKLHENEERMERQLELEEAHKAKEEANQILQEAKDTADEAIRNFNKYGTTRPSIQEMEKQRTNIREKMAANEKKSSKGKDTAIYNPKVPKKLRIGDSVKVLSMNLTGTVHSLPNAKGDLFVQMGILRSQVNIKDLVLIEDAAPGSKKYAKTGAGKLKMSKSASVSTEINLIGKTVDEAIPELDKYLDDAYLAHLEKVRVVHGRGTGALRNGVHQHLRKLKYVKSFHLGEFGEGDSGVTIVTFK